VDAVVETDGESSEVRDAGLDDLLAALEGAEGLLHKRGGG
jgi:hypothetical protein